MIGRWEATEFFVFKSFTGIYGVAVTDFQLYFTDSCGDLWKLNLNENNPKTVRISELQFDKSALAWDGHNIIYLCDMKQDRIVMYEIDIQKFSVFAGTGRAGHRNGKFLEATFDSPNAIFVDKNGDLYVRESNHVRKILLQEGIVTTFVEANFGEIYVDGEDVYGIKGYSILKYSQGSVSKIDLPFEISWNGMVMTPHRTLMIFDDRTLVEVDLENKRTYHLEFDLWSPRLFTIDRKGTVYVGENAVSVIRLEPLWKWERLLWLGNLKDHASYCHLASLPKDIVREIASHL